MQGAVRVINGQQEVWNGTTWMGMYGGSVTINLTKRAEAIIEWADKKMAQEHRAEELAKTKPAVADALTAVNRAQEQLEIILQLTEEQL
jgi:lipid II:glycine glycyltransferase (peptidoglycan interpeptide bridge formation enzyme)